MPEVGLILACSGCCCGHPDRGGALAPPRVLKATTRRLHKASGLADRVRLAFTDCLGPCSEANVMLLYLGGRPFWFRRMNTPEAVEALLVYARDAAADGGAPPLPAELASRSFSWTGGGLGPEPPIVDAEPPEAREGAA
jgi:cobaltochelatase CobN